MACGGLRPVRRVAPVHGRAGHCADGAVAAAQVLGHLKGREPTPLFLLLRGASVVHCCRVARREQNMTHVFLCFTTVWTCMRVSCAAVVVARALQAPRSPPRSPHLNRHVQPRQPLRPARIEHAPGRPRSTRGPAAARAAAHAAARAATHAAALVARAARPRRCRR
jgi:hypothetical protein